MNDLLVGFGLVLVYEGLIWGLAPHMGVKFLEAVADTPVERLRKMGWICVAAGVFLVWLVRG